MTGIPVPFLAGFIGPIGLPELVIIAFIGLLIFGKRLPEMGKSIGKGIVSFKKGLQGVQDEIDIAVNKPEPEKKPEPARLESKGIEGVSSAGDAKVEAAVQKERDSISS